MGGLTEPRARLSVVTTPDGGLCLRLGGELDVVTVAELGWQVEDLLTGTPQPIELDLSDVTFLDSSGVAVLVRLANHFTAVRTRGAPPAVRQVIEVLGLGRRFGLEGA